MSANTILLDFSVKSSQIQNEEQENGLIKILSNYLPQLSKLYNKKMPDGGFIALYTAVRGSFITIRGFPQGLITVNIEYYKEDSEEQLLNFQRIGKLEMEIATSLGGVSSHKMPSIKRGGGLERYFPSSDERILEYDIDAVVFEEISPYQKVQIVHSKSLGNLLILDGLQNLSERDLIYTETLMRRGVENYEGKEIVILGGGDGALLYELLKEKPKFVWMLELDEVVIRACKEHMRLACGDVLDNLKGDNYEIVLGDCMVTISKMVKEGRQFDYVFGDLTDVPVSPTPQGEVWDFIRLIINTSMKILKPTGKYMTHSCGVACPSALRMFEQQFASLDEKVEFSTATAFIPSFLEDWVFYQVWKKPDNN